MASYPSFPQLDDNNDLETPDSNVCKIHIYNLSHVIKSNKRLIDVAALAIMGLKFTRDYVEFQRFNDYTVQAMEGFQLISETENTPIFDSRFHVAFEKVFQAVKTHTLTIEGLKTLQISIPEEYLDKFTQAQQDEIKLSGIAILANENPVLDEGAGNDFKTRGVTSSQVSRVIQFKLPQIQEGINQSKDEISGILRSMDESGFGLK